MFVPTGAQTLAGALGLIVIYQVGTIVYNYAFHPLRKFPGPFYWSLTRIPWIRAMMNGSLHSRIHELHERYGPVVRVAPDELAFCAPEAWKDIYGHRVGAAAGAQEITKHGTFYKITSKLPPSILNEDREAHGHLRRGMSHGFSEKSMREQEPIINGYADILMQRLRELSVDPVTGAPKPVNIVNLYNYFTFDVIGDLSLGEPFGCLKNTEYHPWVKAIFDSLRDIAWVFGAKYLGLDWLVDVAIIFGQKNRKLTMELTEMKLRKRMQHGMERPDFIEGLLKRKEELGLDIGKLRQNASVLIAAGSETTATLLSGVTYLLCTNPGCMEKLKQEVRSTFESEDEITFTSVNNLTYMLACLNEGLRMYPPVPTGLPREVPRGGAMVAGEFIPEKAVVGVYQWAMYHSKKLWKDPFGFHPERFLGDERFADDRRDGLQPFSLGPRNCIGKNLAYAEMRLVLARIIFNFDLELADKTRNWLDQRVFILWEKQPLEVYLTPVRKK